MDGYEGKKREARPIPFRYAVCYKSYEVSHVTGGHNSKTKNDNFIVYVMREQYLYSKTKILL